MGGIGGWVGAGAAPAGIGERMERALVHRGGIARLVEGGLGTGSRARGSAPGGDGAPGPVVADSSFNTPQEVSAAWAASGGESISFASSLRGSFAVAALDPARRRLVLVRDRLGEKPLYYQLSSAGVAFASEIKALRTGADLESIDATALDAFLAFTYIPAPWTIDRDVRTVPAGHVVVIDLARLGEGHAAASAAPYWRLPDREGAAATPRMMLDRLGDALRRRLPRQGDVAVFLSGGLDSGIVTMMAAREMGEGRRLRTFSAAFSESRLDESVHARRVAALASADHHEILIRDVEPEMVRQVLYHLDQPMADAATLPAWILAREASESSRVALTGDGADALLAGDHWFRRLRELERLERLPAAARGALTAAAALAGPARYRRQAARGRLAALDPATRYLTMRQKWTPEERRGVFTPEFARRVQAGAVEGTYLDAATTWRAGGSVDAATRLDARHGLPEGLLMKSDKMGMAHNLETRSPFVDADFAAWCATLDIELMLKGGTGKRLLKEAAESILPRDLVRRRKQGLQVPIGRWLRGPLRALTEEAFDPRRLAAQGIFDPSGLGRLKQRFEKNEGMAALDGQVWQVVAFQTWWSEASRNRA